MSSNPFTWFPSIYPPHEGPANYHHRPSLTGHGAVNKVLLEHSRIYSPTYCYGCFHTTMVNVVEKPHGLKYSLSGPFRKSLLIPILCPNSNPILLAFCFKFSNESLHQILLAPSPIAIPYSSFLLENHNFIWIFIVPIHKEGGLTPASKGKMISLS